MTIPEDQQELFPVLKHNAHARNGDSEVDLKEIWRLLREVEMLIKLHIEDEKQLRPKLQELILLLERSKGAFILLRWFVFITTPVLVAVYWVRDHVRL
jgi:hypothetical protein